MRKKGFTLVELMVSIAILFIILGVISLIITSHMNTYNAGVKNEESGDKVQTYFAYIINDVTPLVEVGENNYDESTYVEIRKSGNPVTKIEIRRSWYEGEGNEYVTYEYSSGELKRKEYSAGREEEVEFTRILDSTRNFDLKGLDIEVAKSSIKETKRVTDKEKYEEVGDLSGWVKLGGFDKEESERFSYYIEPSLKVDTGDEVQELARGYGLRFAPKFEEGPGTPVEDIIFDSPMAVHHGSSNKNDLCLKKGGYVSHSRDGVLHGEMHDHTKDDEYGYKTCKSIKGDSSDNRECIDENEALPRIYPAKYGDLNALTNLGNINQSTTINQGVYRATKMDLKKDKTVVINGNVKLYVSGDIKLDESRVTYATEDSLFLLIQMDNKKFELKKSQLKGFVLGYDSQLKEDSYLEGAMIGDQIARVEGGAHIRFTPCSARYITKEHIENVDAIWW